MRKKGWLDHEFKEGEEHILFVVNVRRELKTERKKRGIIQKTISEYLGRELRDGERLSKRKVMDIFCEKGFGRKKSDIEKEERAIGQKICPVCGKRYKPKYARKEDASPGTIWREQHISGICSDECWNAGLPPEDY